MPSSPAMRKLLGDDTVCHSGGWGCCTGFGTTRARRDAQPLRLPGELRLRPRRDHQARGLLELGQRAVGIDAERRPLGAARTGQAELDPPVREVVEHRGPFGDPQRMVDLERREHRPRDPTRMRSVRCAIAAFISSGAPE